MKIISLALAILGALLILLAVAGRYYDASTVTLMGNRHAAQSLLLAANSVLLLGILVHMIGCCKGSEGK